MPREVSLRHDLPDEGDEHGRKQKGHHPREHRAGQQGQKHVDSHIPPQNRCQEEIRILSQCQNTGRVPIVLCCLDFEPEPAHAEKGQVQAGEHC